MNPRTNYEMTQEDLDTLLNACKRTPCMKIGTSVGSSPQENANRAWAALGTKMGFDSMTVQPDQNKGMKFFSAVPSETDAQKKERIACVLKEFNKTEVVRLLKERDESNRQLHKIQDNVLLSMDGDQWCATRKDFINLQESDAGFGDTMEDAIKDLRTTESKG